MCSSRYCNSSSNNSWTLISSSCYCNRRETVERRTCLEWITTITWTDIIQSGRFSRIPSRKLFRIGTILTLGLTCKKPIQFTFRIITYCVFWKILTRYKANNRTTYSKKDAKGRKCLSGAKKLWLRKKARDFLRSWTKLA